VLGRGGAQAGGGVEIGVRLIFSPKIALHVSKSPKTRALMPGGH